MAKWRRPPGLSHQAVLFAFDPVDWPAGSYEPVPLQMFEGRVVTGSRLFALRRLPVGIGLPSIRIRALVTGWIC